MLKINQCMMDQIALIHGFDDPLSKGLADVVFGGFEERGGCYFVSRLMKAAANVSANDFPDRTGFECFVNSVHIDDYVNKDYLLCAIKFSDALLSAWRESYVSIRLEVIISADEYGAMVKCHVAREGEYWISSDLDKYSEAILVCDSSLDGSLVMKIISIIRSSSS